jgi:putative lipoprotein
MRLRPILYVLATVALGPAGLAGAASEAQVTGTATYLDRAMLPPGAVLSVALQDISVADAPAEVIATATQAIEGGPPYPFALAYDPGEIQERHTYSVRARVTLDDRLIMVTDTFAPVITRGAPTEVELIMRRVTRGRAEDRPEHRDAEVAMPMRGMFRYEAGAVPSAPTPRSKASSPVRRSSPCLKGG